VTYQRLDPIGCGCTDCLTGYSVPEDCASADVLAQLRPNPVDTAYAYLVIGDTGGIGWAGLNAERAHEYAANTGGVVVRLPIDTDYRRNQP
jgi:hypothetical protein